VPSQTGGVASSAPPAADDEHLAELAELRRFEDERRRRTDFAAQPSGDRALGSDPYQLRPLGDGSRLVGLLRGGDAVVLVDRRGRELARAPAPPSPTALAVDGAERIWVGGTGSAAIAVYRLADGPALVRAATFRVTGAWTVRALAASKDGAWLYAADERSGLLSALALDRGGRAIRQYRVGQCRSPIQLAHAGGWLIANCLNEHALLAYRLEPQGAPSAAPTALAPLRMEIDGPFWSVAAAAAGDLTIVAAGGVEDHPLERKNGGFGYIDSFLYLYSLPGSPASSASFASSTAPAQPARAAGPRRLAAVNLSAEGVVTPKWLTLELDGDGGAVVQTAGYASSVLATLSWRQLASGRSPAVATRPFMPGTTDWSPSPSPAGENGREPGLAASPLFDGWIAAGEGAPELVSAAPAPHGPMRSVESRVGEALFFTTLMAPWNRSDGKLSRFTCETCHFEAYGDGRIHFTGRGAVHSTTKPLRGLFNNRPHFSRALDRTMAEMVHAEFRVANRWNGRDPWFSLEAADFPWLAATGGVPATLSPLYLRRALMSFLMDLTFEPNQAVRGRRHFSDSERTGAALFRGRCESCHRSRLIAEEPASAVPFESWEELIFSPQGPIVWASSEYRKTGVEPYVHPEGARTSSLRRLVRKFPYFTNGSARTLGDVVSRAAWAKGAFFHDSAPGGAEHLRVDEQVALLAFLELL